VLDTVFTRIEELLDAQAAAVPSAAGPVVKIVGSKIKV
jgi:hypothetical protein